MSGFSVTNARQETTTQRARDFSIDYLRTALTLLVIAHHSAMAYTSWASFNPKAPLLSTSPIVDPARWAGFDIFINFNDVFFMSLMFFISGLFVYPVLRRQGPARFIQDRLLRLGVPFVGAVVVLIPLAYYASWQLAGRPEGYGEYYGQLARGGFTVGPPWFIWVLLLFDVVVALIAWPLRDWLPRLAPALARLRLRPVAAAAAATGLAAAVYYPAVVRYGPSAWTVLFTSPFAFQMARLGLYALWFSFGFLVGLNGLISGLLAPDGHLARRWPWWVGASLLAYLALWFIPRTAHLQHLVPGWRQLVESLLLVASCVASCFASLALFRGVRMPSWPWMNSLSRSAYVMYLVHYVFVCWLQLLVLPWPLAVGLKFGFVLLATIFLSWLTAQGLLRVPKLKDIL